MKLRLLLLVTLVALAGEAWAANDFVRTGPDSTGKRIDNESFTRGPDTIYRQRVRICGADDTDCVAATGSTPTPTSVGLITKGFLYLQRDDAATTTCAEDAYCIARLNSNRDQRTMLVDSNGAEVSVGGGTQYDEDTIHVSGDKLTLAGAVRRDSPASSSSTDGDRSTINVDGSGRLWVNGSSVTQPVSVASLPLPTGASTGSTVGSAVPSTATAAGFSDGTNTQIPRVFDADSGGGVQWVSGVILRKSASGGSVEIGTATDPLIIVGPSADDSTNSTTKLPVLACKATASPPTWTEGRQSPLSCDLAGNLRVKIEESGTTQFRRISTADTNAATIKASAGVAYAINCTNVNAAFRYLKLYNKASNPSVGTDTPVRTIAIPPASGNNQALPVDGLAFTTGIAMAMTTGATDADTGGVAANEIICHVDYR